MYGKAVNTNVKRTRSYVADGSTAAMTKASAARKEVALDVDVTVQAHYDGETYAVVVDAAGHQATVPNVRPDDLAGELSRVIKAVSRAIADGTLTKARHGVRDTSPWGLGAPTKNRDALTLG